MIINRKGGVTIDKIETFSFQRPPFPWLVIEWGRFLLLPCDRASYLSLINHNSLSLETRSPVMTQFLRKGLSRNNLLRKRIVFRMLSFSGCCM